VRARAFVTATGVGAAAVAAILSPIPLADEVLLLPALIGVGAVVGLERGIAFGALPWRALAAGAVAGLAARGAINLVVATVPVIAAAANAATAFALTRAYASWAEGECRARAA
jgi:hypothetical protein